MAQRQTNRQHTQHHGSAIRPEIDVQKSLKGMDYPASKEDLIAHAKDHGASDDVMSMLQGIDNKTYKSPIQVTKEVAKNL
jgi:hypothetical protein